ncbi:MAG: iron complex outermembrane receptor protein [Hyphomicrobiaceae bacterium]|jgi:iron complex outermembrane receptor protein
MPYHAALVAACVVIASQLAVAQELPVEAGTASERPLVPAILPATTVTASRVATELSQVPAATTIVGRNEITSSPALALDQLLARQPGFRLFRDQSSLVAHPTTQGASLRGVGPNGAGRALVLVDGLPLNDAFGGWIYWNKVPLVGVERIEVLRGGGSSLWGSGALGGIVHVVSTQATHDFERFNLSFADPGTQTLEALVARRRGRNGLVIDGKAFHTDGYPVLRRSDRGAIDGRASSEHGVLNLRYSYDLSRRTQARLGFRVFGEQRSNGTALTNNRTRAAMVRAGLRHKTREGSTLAVDAFARWQTFESTFSSQVADRSSESPALDQFDVPSFETGGSAVWSLATGRRGVLVTGADALVAQGETNEKFFFSNGRFIRRRRAGGRRALVGVWAEEIFELLPSLTVTAGLRADWWHLRSAELALENLDSDAGETVTPFADRDDILVSPKLGLAWQVSDLLSLRTSVYRGFRAPTINELYRPFRVRSDITAANENLRAETLWGGEWGFDLGNRNSRGSMTFFWNELEDPVFNLTVGAGPGTVGPCGFVPDGGVCRQRRNLGRARIRGIEADVHHNFGTGWSTSFAWLFSDTEIRRADQAPDLRGNRLPQVPRHTVVTRLAWERGPVFASSGVRWSDDRFEDDRNTRSLGDYATVEAALGWHLTPSWTLVVAVENLFGRDFEVSETADGVIGIGAPRFVHFGLRYESNDETLAAANP